MRISFLEKVKAMGELIRLTKQYGTFLLMLPTLWSLTVASKGMPSLKLLAIFVIGSFLMRSAGCVINDIADRNFDPYVERTRNRPLASGRLTITEAVVLFLLLILLATGLVLLLNPICLLLSIPALFLATLYPFTKRYIHIPQVVLGIAFGWGGLIAWAAVENKIGLPAILIFLATIFWATAYDTIYALIDIEDDLKIGVKSTAIFFGRYSWIGVAISLALVLFFLFLLGFIAGLGKIYYFSLVLIGVHFIYQVIKVRGGSDPATLFRLFKSNVGVGVLVLLGIVFNYIV